MRRHKDLHALPLKERERLALEEIELTLRDDVTLREVGNVLGFTRERIRQIEAGAIAKLGRILAAQGKTFASLLPGGDE